ncbi:hypothetical protein TWF481_002919 [Arthrobotrys musiformis]|uniref:Uncharacterized protein n=1 Tax=Arthrobotrys musiformis TaxID=47236 RepID=A0AAV9VTP7_9PEZI
MTPCTVRDSDADVCVLFGFWAKLTPTSSQAYPSPNAFFSRLQSFGRLRKTVSQLFLSKASVIASVFVSVFVVNVLVINVSRDIIFLALQIIFLHLCLYRQPMLSERKPPKILIIFLREIIPCRIGVKPFFLVRIFVSFAKVFPTLLNIIGLTSKTTATPALVRFPVWLLRILDIILALRPLSAVMKSRFNISITALSYISSFSVDSKFSFHVWATSFPKQRPNVARTLRPSGYRTNAPRIYSINLQAASGSGLFFGLKSSWPQIASGTKGLLFTDFCSCATATCARTFLPDLHSPPQNNRTACELPPVNLENLDDEVVSCESCDASDLAVNLRRKSLPP